MTLTEINAELDHLSPTELRELALKSWTAFVRKEARADALNVCEEDDPELLAALDAATARADHSPGQGHSAAAVRARLDQWTSA